ncbi:MAG TPA: DUF6036 family nucleotidyltransferase [Bryobacteraceae bacterium]|nr:DUF6036 family nucleotidyltransferase [Bryobacteraceae bacterium]
MPSIEEPPEPWRSFFAELDARLSENVQLHCCGGFVATKLYGVARETNDVDFLAIVPNAWGGIAELAGEGSPLYRTHKLYLDAVTVATPPENYEQRLVEMFPGAWTHLQLYALEAHDLALTKLQRNFDRDRDDIQQLAAKGHLNSEVLKKRYYEELRPYLVNEERHDLTLQLWLESCWPDEPIT